MCGKSTYKILFPMTSHYAELLFIVIAYPNHPIKSNPEKRFEPCVAIGQRAVRSAGFEFAPSLPHVH